MHEDSKGNVLARGDRVQVTGTVVDITESKDHCNVTVQLDRPCKPARAPHYIPLNAAQVEKVGEPGDTQGTAKASHYGE